MQDHVEKECLAPVCAHAERWYNAPNPRASSRRPTMDLERPTIPGLFTTATGTGVGKTVVSCLLADQYRRRSPDARIGVLKPIATGCRREREGLVSDDAEQLAHAAAFDPAIGDLTTVNPIRFRPPVAPAAALAPHPVRSDDPIAPDWTPLNHALRRMNEHCDALIVEGIGGIMVPLTVPAKPNNKHDRPETVLDLIAALDFPTIVVADAALGTLNHTAMTCSLLASRGVRIAGVILNRFDPASDDESMHSNPAWIMAQNKVPVLATLPDLRFLTNKNARCSTWNVLNIHPALRDAVDTCDFTALAKPPRAARERP